MTIKTASTQVTDPIEAANALRTQLPGDPKLVLYFLSAQRDPQVTAALMRESFPGAITLGCTTAGELSDDRMLTDALVAGAFYDDDLHAAHAVQVADPNDPDAVRAGLREIQEELGDLSQLDPSEVIGIVLQDGMRGTEETVMSTLSTLCNVPFVGGSAGDRLAFKGTHTCLNGSAREGSAVLCVLRSKRRFAILKTQSFDVTATQLEATDVDEATRTVRAFDGRPAAEAYADALGVTLAELPDRFMRNPLGLVMSDGEPYVRSPQQRVGTDVVFYCSVKQGMRLSVLESRDIVADTRRDLAGAIAELGSCSAIVNFHCILRTLELVEKEQCDAYGAVFAGYPTVGFSTYGESYIGHINQTSTMLLFA